MGKRREGREAAIQFLYQLDTQPELQPADLFAAFWKLRSGPERPSESPKMRAYTEQLVTGVAEHREAIDERIRKAAANYELHRIAVVDRAILRLAIYEMLHATDVPPVVVINEAIEIAKRFGGDESGRFVNGVLDRIRAELGRNPREGVPRPDPRLPVQPPA